MCCLLRTGGRRRIRDQEASRAAADRRTPKSKVPQDHLSSSLRWSTRLHLRVRWHFTQPFFFCFFSHGIQHLTCTFVNVSFSNVRHKLLGVRGEVSTHISTCCSGARSFFISCPFRFRAQQQKTRFSVFEQSHNHSSAVEGANQKSRTHIRGSDPPPGEPQPQNKRKTKCIRLHFSIGVSPLRCLLSFLLLLLLPFLLLLLHLFPNGVVVARIYSCVCTSHRTHVVHTLGPPAPRSRTITHHTASPISSFHTGGAAAAAAAMPCRGVWGVRWVVRNTLA